MLMEMRQTPVDDSDGWTADGCVVSVVLGIDGVYISLWWVMIHSGYIMVMSVIANIERWINIFNKKIVIYQIVTLKL